MSCDNHMIPRKELGSLRLKVQCHEERILDTQFYTPFVEFMLNVVDDKRVCNSECSWFRRCGV